MTKIVKLNLTKGDMIVLSKQGAVKYPEYENVPMFVKLVTTLRVYVNDLFGNSLWLVLSKKDVNPYYEGQEL